MRPLYDARVEDLTPHDRLRIECGCRRIAHISVTGLGLPGWTRVLALKPRLRCENCNRKGELDLTVIWAER
jgi:hypothetical protein